MTQSDASPLSRAQPLIQLIYRAAVHSTVWNEFLEQLSKALGGPKIGLNLELPDQPASTLNFQVGDASYGAVFADYAARKQVPWPLEELIGIDRFVRGNDFFPDEEVIETPFYRDYMAPQGLEPVGVVGHVFGSDGKRPLGAIGIYRRKGGREIDALDHDMLNLLVPHLEQAYEIHRRLVASGRRRDALAEVMDRFPTGVILLNEARQVVGTNRAADLILAADDGFNLKEGVPVATLDDGSLQELLSRVVRDGKEVGSGKVVSLARLSGRRAYQAFVSRLLAAPESGASQSAVAVIFLSDPDDQHICMPELLVSLYQLTLAEAELVALLCQGESLDDASRIRGVSPHTARSQLKGVFAKTGVARQAELVRLLMTSVTGLADRRTEP